MRLEWFVTNGSFFFFFKSVAYLAFEISLTACSSLGNVGLSLKTEAKYKSLDWNRYIPKTLLMIILSFLTRFVWLSDR